MYTENDNIHAIEITEYSPTEPDFPEVKYLLEEDEQQAAPQGPIADGLIPDLFAAFKTNGGPYILGFYLSLNKSPIYGPDDISFVRNPVLIWNSYRGELLVIGDYGKGRVFNPVHKSKSALFQLEGGNQILDGMWNDELQRFIVVGYNGGVYLSQHGREWEKRQVPVTVRLTGISWGLKQCVAIGDQGTIITSSDLKAWQVIIIPGNYNLISIIYNKEWEEYLVLYADPNLKNRRGILKSSDGLIWEDYPDVMPADVYCTSITWITHRKEYMGVANDRIVITSDDGEVWSLRQLPKRHVLSERFFSTPNFDLRKVIYISSRKVVVIIGTDFAIYYSFDGSAWFNLIQAMSLFENLKWVGSLNKDFISIAESN